MRHVNIHDILLYIILVPLPQSGLIWNNNYDYPNLQRADQKEKLISPPVFNFYTVFYIYSNLFSISFTKLLRSDFFPFATMLRLLSNSKKWFVNIQRNIN